MKSTPRAVLFDVFGTTVDWHAGLCHEFMKVAHFSGRAAPSETLALGLVSRWASLALSWHALYGAATSDVRTGKRPWTDFEVILHESLEQLLEKQGLSSVDRDDRQQLVMRWRHLMPWKDVIPGLLRMKGKFVIAPLSNGHIAMLTEMAKRAGLPWDLVLSAELFRQYKTHPDVYRGACGLLRCEPDEVMLVASHRPDLDAARGVGLRTAYVHRPLEFGKPAEYPATITGPDLVVSDFLELAKELGV